MDLPELSAIYEALDRVQAIIEFELDGTVIKANDNFLRTLGYRLDEIDGQHHRMFCDSGYADSQEYTDFWKKLGRGEYTEAEFKRLAKDGEEVWLQASYNPVFGEGGKPVKVVKFATNVTASKLKTAEYEGMVAAINRVQAVIEFELDGTVINANENFLRVFGYRLDEIIGQHHRMFCEPAYAQSSEYAELWRRLGEGEFEAGDFKRKNKAGGDVWLQASYNPIFDMDGRPRKVVKFASDITRQVEARDLVLKMSTPVTAIWQDILMLPVVGIIDSGRAQDIMNAILTEVAETQARVIIVDISGVAVVDTAVANHLIKITKATRLMGCECKLSGVSAAIAQTMVELGIEVGDVKTTATLKDALVEAFQMTGAEIRNAR
jgi:methyl-accepting chemotaxis protein